MKPEFDPNASVDDAICYLREFSAAELKPTKSLRTLYARAQVDARLRENIHSAYQIADLVPEDIVLAGNLGEIIKFLGIKNHITKPEQLASLKDASIPRLKGIGPIGHPIVMALRTIARSLISEQSQYPLIS